MRILVTGGAGFIGSHLVEALSRKKYEIRIIDDFSTGKWQNIEKFKNRIEIIRGDISKKEAVEKAMEDVDYVFHEAALTSVVESFKFPLKTWEVNIRGTKFLLNAAEKNKVKRFIFASSAAVYGDEPTLPKRETMGTRAVSPYGESKSIGELTLESSARRTGLKTVSLRYFNVYGPRQDPNSEYSGVISRFIGMMLNEKRPVIYGDGNQTRDFIYVKDVVEANLLVVKKKEAVGQVFNIATGRPTSINELVETINEILGTDIKPIYEKSRLGDIRHSYADITKARTLLGFEPKYTLKEGLKKTIEWFRKSEGYGD